MGKYDSKNRNLISQGTGISFLETEKKRLNKAKSIYI